MVFSLVPVWCQDLRSKRVDILFENRKIGVDLNTFVMLLPEYFTTLDWPLIFFCNFYSESDCFLLDFIA